MAHFRIVTLFLEVIPLIKHASERLCLVPVKGILYVVFKEDKMNPIKLISARFLKNEFSTGTNRVVLVFKFRYGVLHICKFAWLIISEIFVHLQESCDGRRAICHQCQILLGAWWL